MTYVQPVYSYQLLQRIASVNGSALQRLTLSEDLGREGSKIRLPKGSSLSELVNLGIRDQTTSPVVLSTLFAELAKQTRYAHY